MKTKVMKGNFKTLLKHFCLESSFPGLKYLYLYPDWISRCFWAVTLLLLNLFAIGLTGLLYSRFITGPTRIMITNQYAPLSELPFPAVTVCSPNQITLTALDHLNKALVNGDRNVDLNEYLPLLIGSYESMDPSQLNVTMLQRLQELCLANRYTVREVMSLVPQSCDDFLKLCIFQQERQDCRKLFRPLLTKFGLCCVFNSPYHFDKNRNVRDRLFKPVMATTLGQADALTVVVDYAPETAMNYSIVKAGGSRVLFTDWSEFPTGGESELVYPNTQALLVIRATHTDCSDDVKELPPNSRNCTLEDEVKLNHFDKYRNSDCEHVCYVKNIRSQCDCLPWFLPYARTDQVCNMTNIPCVAMVKLQNFSLKCKCQRDCVSNKYSVDMSVGNLNGLQHMAINPYESVNFRNSNNILHMFFSGSSFLKRSQEMVMPKINLFSNLGGIYGLCLGFSVISLLELIFYIFKAIWNCLSRCSRSNVHQLRQQNAIVD